jgi:uncharacterized surface protein with fasciclin (FAS1) repeats
MVGHPAGKRPARSSRAEKSRAFENINHAVHPITPSVRFSGCCSLVAQRPQKELMMKRKILNPMIVALTFALAATSLGGAAVAKMHSKNPMVGGAAMMPSKTIVENASKAKNLTTLVAAVQAAGLVETLSSPGPFTVFAPTNAAFGKLPAGTVETLVKPENKDTLTTILTYHVVAGRFTAADVMKAIKAGGGTASLTTVQGGTLTAKMQGAKLVLTDAKGGMSTVTTANVMQSNGVVHVIDSVLMP